MSLLESIELCLFEMIIQSGRPYLLILVFRLLKINTTISVIRFDSKFVPICYLFLFSLYFSFFFKNTVLLVPFSLHCWYFSYASLFYLFLVVALGFIMCIFNISLCKLMYSHVIEESVRICFHFHFLLFKCLPLD